MFTFLLVFTEVKFGVEFSFLYFGTIFLDFCVIALVEEVFRKLFKL